MRIKYFLFYALIIASVSACDNGALQQREEALTAREEALLLREKELQLKIDEWNQKQKDTVQHIPFLPLPDSLAGFWNVSMVCTETTCPTFAVGDKRSEVWEFSGSDSSIIVKASNNKKLIRVYTGQFTGTQMVLTTPQIDSAQKEGVKMRVEIAVNSATKLKGVRSITQQDGCQSLFSMDLDKSKK